MSSGVVANAEWAITTSNVPLRDVSSSGGQVGEEGTGCHIRDESLKLP